MLICSVLNGVAYQKTSPHGQQHPHSHSPAVQAGSTQLTMLPPTAHKALNSTMIRLGCNTCQQLRRRPRVWLVAGDGRGSVVRSCSSRFSTEASPVVNVAPEDRSVTAPAPARGASLPTLKKPVNGYLNKVN